MELRPRKATSSVVSIPPQLEKEYQAPTGYVTPPPPVLSPQVTSTEELQMPGSREVASDTELLAIAEGAQHAAVADPHPSVLTSHPPTQCTHARSAATEKALES